ncbi:Hypothetical Protein FCC1311_080412 [Hondaea fermentalgiana]|uniref:Uncharacterized protein n=1 Tax=Hondaea fermentalgiana TaxID=2315210 RepID=A0A2R5GLP0_9STRA|nr:Hypothetical Protein FCC1311_080412 [Hondaea fermentalgiana]|eukprot:GBG31816.1 Hypothetical Protein FCC1311_080412 [Hondaea fermentalgiana]
MQEVLELCWLEDEHLVLECLPAGEVYLREVMMMMMLVPDSVAAGFEVVVGFLLEAAGFPLEAAGGLQELEGDLQELQVALLAREAYLKVPRDVQQAEEVAQLVEVVVQQGVVVVQQGVVVPWDVQLGVEAGLLELARPLDVAAGQLGVAEDLQDEAVDLQDEVVDLLDEEVNLTEWAAILLQEDYEDEVVLQDREDHEDHWEVGVHLLHLEDFVVLVVEVDPQALVDHAVVEVLRHQETEGLAGPEASVVLQQAWAAHEAWRAEVRAVMVVLPLVLLATVETWGPLVIQASLLRRPLA